MERCTSCNTQFSLLKSAFSPPVSLQTLSSPETGAPIPVAHRFRQPNCLAVGVTSGIRGAAIGTAFGLAMGISTAVQSGYRGSAALTYAGQGALRNAAAFGSWTALYATSRCGLVRLRGRNDIANAAIAGGATGGFLTFLSVRGYWRYNRPTILYNAGASALIAVVFDALKYF